MFPQLNETISKILGQTEEQPLTWITSPREFLEQSKLKDKDFKNSIVTGDET